MEGEGFVWLKDPGAIIAYQQTVHRWTVVAILADQGASGEVIILGEGEILKMVEVSLSPRPAHAGGRAKVVIFTSVSFALTQPLEEFTEKGMKIIIPMAWDDDIEEVKKVIARLPEINMSYLRAAEDRVKLSIEDKVSYVPIAGGRQLHIAKDIELVRRTPRPSTDIYNVEHIHLHGNIGMKQIISILNEFYRLDRYENNGEKTLTVHCYGSPLKETQAVREKVGKHAKIEEIAPLLLYDVNNGKISTN